MTKTGPSISSSAIRGDRGRICSTCRRAASSAVSRPDMMLTPESLRSASSRRRSRRNVRDLRDGCRRRSRRGSSPTASGLEHVWVERRDVDAHLTNRRTTARCRFAIVSRTVLVVVTRSVPAGSTTSARRSGRRVGGNRRRFGTDATQDHRPLGVPRGVDPVRDPGSRCAMTCSEDTVRVDHRLVTVEAGDVLRVIDRLPPDVPMTSSSTRPMGGVTSMINS